MSFPDAIELLKAAGDLVGKVGVPAALLGYVLWRIEPRLDKLIEAVKDVSDVDKTAARLKPVMDAQAAKIIDEISHDTRAAIQPVFMAVVNRRGGA